MAELSCTLCIDRGVPPMENAMAAPRYEETCCLFSDELSNSHIALPSQHCAIKRRRTSLIDPPGTHRSLTPPLTRYRRISQHARYTCTFCGKNSVKRQSTGIWGCRSCKRVTAGGAYTVSYVQTAPNLHGCCGTPKGINRRCWSREAN